jgi:hypothetical protein
MNTEVAKPWHKEFWFWFIFGLPATVVVASLITVYIAFKNADSLVKDDYYSEGLAINRELGRQKVANELGINVQLNIDLVSGEVIAVISSNEAIVDGGEQNLNIEFIHPTNMKRDFSLPLASVSEQKFYAQLESKIQGKWYLQIDGVKPEPWQLKTEIKFGDESSQLHEWLIQ